MIASGFPERAGHILPNREVAIPAIPLFTSRMDRRRQHRVIEGVPMARLPSAIRRPRFWGIDEGRSIRHALLTNEMG